MSESRAEALTAGDLPDRTPTGDGAYSSTNEVVTVSFLIEWMTQTWGMVLEAAPWLLFGFLLAGFVYILLPTDKVVAHLGRPGLLAVIKAALIGVPLPLCSCSVIPVASSIRKRGASQGATASFLISTPESGVDSIAISYALLGPLLAAVRPVAAFASAALAGGLIAARERSRPPLTEPRDRMNEEKTCCSCCGDAVQTPRASPAGKTVEALRYGLVEMFTDLGHWLLLGFLLGGFFAALLPAGFLERSIGTGPVAMLLMLLAGLPLYVCATSATPVAAALIAKGLSPGAALVFLLVGPATNVATMVVVTRDLGKTGLVIYLASIAVVAVAFGLGVDAIARAMVTTADSAQHSVHDHASPLAWVSAVLLAALVFNGIRLRARRAWHVT
jgi:uncharacterized membrane protein YraQ (UPF0718 family)